MISRLMNIYQSHKKPKNKATLLCYAFLSSVCVIPGCAGLLVLVPACFCLYQLAQGRFIFFGANSPNILTYKLTKNQPFYYKSGLALLQCGGSFHVFVPKLGQLFYYRAGQVVLQSTLGIIKWDNFYYRVG